MRRLSKLLPCAVLAVSVPAVAQSEDCLTVLESCEICVQRNGLIDIRACGQSPTSEDGMPAELLEEPATDELDGLQKLIAEQILSHWDVLDAVFGDPNRIYLPREAFDLASRYPGATADEVLRAAVIRFQSSLIAKASRARVERVPAGDGGEKLVIRTHDVLMVFAVRLLTDAGAFADVDLEDFVVSDKLGVAPDTARPEVDELFELFERFLRLNQVGLRSARVEAAIAGARR